MSNNAKPIIDRLRTNINIHKPEIYLGIGMALMTSSVVLGITATPKVMSIIKEREQEEGCKLTALETVQATWKNYVPTVVTLVLGGVCIVSGTKMQNSRYAAVAAAYKISENAFSELETKVVEEIGHKKMKNIKDEIAKDNIEAHPIDDRVVFLTNSGGALCYDIISDRYFRADIDDIKRRVNDFNEDLLNEMFMSLNDFYYMINLPPLEAIGDLLGWDVMYGKMEVEYSSQLLSKEGPCLTIDYRRNIRPL